MNAKPPSTRASLAAVIGGGLVLIVLTWAAGLWPSIGQQAVSPALAQATTAPDAPAWVGRLGVSGIEPWTSPNPRFDDQLSLVADTPAAIALRRDLCTGQGMQPDHHFRQARAALVRNDASLCTAPADHIAARSPLVVALGPVAGWGALGLLAAAGLGLVGWGLVSRKLARDRWRLVGRSTFGEPRRAGSG